MGLAKDVWTKPMENTETEVQCWDRTGKDNRIPFSWFALRHTETDTDGVLGEEHPGPGK